MNYYPHHIGDFNNATRHLTRVERSVYRDATELYYDTEKPLSLDIKSLEKKLICITDEEKKALKDILDEFFIVTDDGYFQSRCDLEIEKFKSNISAKAKAGRASAEIRRQNIISKSTQFNTCSTDVQQNVNEIQLTKNQEPLTSNHEPLTNNQSIHQQADKESIFPQGSLSKSIYEQKRIKVLRQMPMMARIGKWFNRKEDTLWTVAEAKALKQIKPTNDDLDILEKYYSDRTSDKPLRKSIDTLLNNWSGELDRANTFIQDSKPKENKTNYVNTLSDTSKFVRSL